MSKFAARQHGFDRFLPPEAPVEPPNKTKEEEAPSPPNRNVSDATPTRANKHPPPEPPITKQAETSKRRQISLYISETEDKLLEKERSRRLAVGSTRRGADFASLIRQAIRTTYGPR